MIKEPVVILANGDYPTHPIPVQKLSKAGWIICCDGAVNSMIENNMEPHVIIGDLDSIDPILKSKYKNRMIPLQNQDENDLRKAISWAENEGIKDASIIGATGKRDDHSLANIFTLLEFPTSLKCTLITDHGFFSTAEGTTELQSFNGQQISLFSTDPDIEITSTNLKYYLNRKKLNTIYSGSLNESNSATFTLDLSYGKILVYQVFE